MNKIKKVARIVFTIKLAKWNVEKWEVENELRNVEDAVNRKEEREKPEGNQPEEKNGRCAPMEKNWKIVNEARRWKRYWEKL